MSGEPRHLKNPLVFQVAEETLSYLQPLVLYSMVAGHYLGQGEAQRAKSWLTARVARQALEEAHRHRDSLSVLLWTWVAGETWVVDVGPWYSHSKDMCEVSQQSE